MTALLLVAVAISAMLIVLIGLDDPKRQRSVGLRDRSQSLTVRRLLVAGAAFPGVAYALAGEAASLLVWLGASTVVGWIITISLPGAASSSKIK